VSSCSFTDSLDAFSAPRANFLRKQARGRRVHDAMAKAPRRAPSGGVPCRSAA
jgi:hypothetical protein